MYLKVSICEFRLILLDKKGSPTGEEGDEKKFDPSGYDKDLVENLERDIVSGTLMCIGK